MPDTRIVVEPAKLTYKGGDVRLTWSRVVEVSVRHWGWTTLVVLTAIGGLIGGYFINGIEGVIFSILIDGADLLLARKAVRRSLRAERQST